MSRFLDENEQLIRFVLLTCGLLTLAGAVACLILGNAVLAVACCIVSAWAIGFYLDTILGQVSDAQRGRSGDESQDFRTYK